MPNTLESDELSPFPSPGELLWHGVGSSADPVRLTFNQLGCALAKSAKVPTVLHLHAFILRTHSSFFRAALDAAAVGSTSPVLPASTLSVPSLSPSLPPSNDNIVCRLFMSPY